MLLDSTDRSNLAEVFSQAQRRGWVGGPGIDHHIEHSLGFASAVGAAPAVAVDLGSGAGLPALVLAAVWPHSKWTLVESSLRRAAFLEQHCAGMGWSDRIVVCHDTAQNLASLEQYRAKANLVTARSFGPLSQVVEVAVPLLTPGGQLVVSAAPDAVPWPAELLSPLGMAPDRLTQSPPRFHRSVRLA